MVDQTTNGKPNAPVRRDPNAPPEDMVIWVFGGLYDFLNRVLERLYFLI